MSRAPVELYLARSSVAGGKTEVVTVLSAPHARVTLLVLLPDGRYLSHVMTVSDNGRGTHTFTVPKLQGHPHSRTVLVEATVNKSSGTYLATSHFVVR